MSELIERLNRKLEAAGFEDRVELNPPGSPATYGMEGPCMVAGYSCPIELEQFVDILVQSRTTS